MLALLGSLPVIGSIVTAITSSFFDAKVRLLMARFAVTRDVATATIQASVAENHDRVASLGVIAGSRLLTLLIICFAAPIVAFEMKVVVWDTMLGWGETPAIHGQVAQWMNTIINWLFGSSTVLAAGQMAMSQVRNTK